MSTVGKVFKRNTTVGDIGVELEFEGSRLPETGFEQFWSKCADGSLRGESAEYVLAKPLSRADTEAALKQLSDNFKKSKTVIYPTFRAGTHIHLNVQELSLVQLINLLTIYFMFEGVLIKLCREDRVGNHFCLRAKDASALISMLHRVVSKGNISDLANDQYRYAAVNLTSLPKFGSLEFRALESSLDWDKLLLWIDLHLAIREAAKQFRDPASILGEASVQGFKDFAKLVFKDHWAKIEPLYDELEVQEGVWEIQSVVFAKDWSTVNHNIFANSNIFDLPS